MEQWKNFVNWSEVSRSVTGNRCQIKSNYLDEPSRRKYRKEIELLRDNINNFIQTLNK